MLHLFYILFFIFSGISYGINEQVSSKFIKISETSHSLEKLEECVCSAYFDILIEQGKYSRFEAKHSLNFTQSQNKTTECGNALFSNIQKSYMNGKKLLFLVVENSPGYKLLKASSCNNTTLVPISCVNKNIVIFKSPSRNFKTSQEQDGAICGSVVWEIQQSKSNSCLVVSFPILDKYQRNKYYNSEVIPCSNVTNDGFKFPFFDNDETYNLKNISGQNTEESTPAQPECKITKLGNNNVLKCGSSFTNSSIPVTSFTNSSENNTSNKDKNSQNHPILTRSTLEVNVPKAASLMQKISGNQCLITENIAPGESGSKNFKRDYRNQNHQSPEQIVAEHYDQYERILFGIIIENHSKYRLINPRYTRTCENNEIIPSHLDSIEGSSIDVLVVKNDLKKGVCGSITWDIDGLDAKEIKVSFDIPYNGKCWWKSKRRNNRYSINISEGHKGLNLDNNVDQSDLRYTTTRCIKTVWENGSIRLSGKLLPLKEENDDYKSAGENCAPILTMQVHIEQKSFIIKYYTHITVSIILCAIVLIVVIIFARKCRRSQKPSLSFENDITPENEKDIEDNRIAEFSPNNKDEVDMIIYDKKFVIQKSLEDNDISNPVDQTELAQVYLSVTSYDMVYMSQTSHDLLKNYRPAIPMPFLTEIKANSCEVITEQPSAELYTVGERRDGSKSGSDGNEHGSI